MRTDIFKAFESLNILIVGDVMIDRYLRGSSTRISPEAPVPVVDLDTMEDRLGGAANVALNIKAMGATPYLFSVIGEDADAIEFIQLLKDAELYSEGIISSKDRKTTVKTRVVVGSQQLLRIDSETRDDLDTLTEAKYLESIALFLENKKIDAMIFQDYNKGVLSEHGIGMIMSMTKKHGIPSAVDPKRKNFLAYRAATLFKPNLKEIRDVLPFKVIAEPESLKAAARYLRTKIGNQYTMITLSEKGLYIEDEHEGIIVPTQARNVSDVSGAGDTVISIAVLGLALGLDMRNIAILSNLGGGQVCQKPGVVPVDKEKLKSDFAGWVASA